MKFSLDNDKRFQLLSVMDALPAAGNMRAARDRKILFDKLVGDWDWVGITRRPGNSIAILDTEGREITTEFVLEDADMECLKNCLQAGIPTVRGAISRMLVELHDELFGVPESEVEFLKERSKSKSKEEKKKA